MGRGSEQALFQSKHTDGKKAHGKMFIISYYQENENQNNNEISPYICENGYYPNDKKQVWERTWREGNSYVLFVGVQIGETII